MVSCSSQVAPAIDIIAQDGNILVISDEMVVTETDIKAPPNTAPLILLSH